MIEIKVDIKPAIQYLDSVQRKQVPFAAALALTRIAQASEKDLKTEMQGTFDRPTGWTLRGTYYTSADKRVLQAVVGLKDKTTSGGRPAGKYLQAQLGGGARRTTGYELALTALGALPEGWRAMPAEGAKLDRYGNLNKAQLTEIIGALKSGSRVYKGKGKRLSATGYFIARPGIKQTAHLKPGIYYRIERGGKSAIIPVLIFTQRAAYQRKLDLPRIVRRTIDRRFQTEFNTAFARALATAR